MTGPSGVGIWSFELRYNDPAVAAEMAAELEALGYTALWIPDVGGDVFGPLERLLEATSSAVIATGILNVWMHTAADTAAWRAGLTDDGRARLLVGIGISHAPFIDAQPGMTWERPLATMATYLDALDEHGVPADGRCLAALGPRMLDLAASRSLGAHPYLVTPEHTAMARERLGDARLFVEQGVVLETDPEAARAVARQALSVYTGLPNYTNNWRRLGYTEEDVTGPSDRLVDGVVAWGDVDTIAARVRQHLDAGADHVCVQVLTPPGTTARPAWRELAPAFNGS